MAIETVTVTPLFGTNDDGDPVPPGSPLVLTPIAIAPGNTSLAFGRGGDQDSVEFTVYFRLTTYRVENNALVLTNTADVIADDYGIRVRGRDCLTRVRVWRSPRTDRGGVEVLCRSVTGKDAQ